MIPHPIRLRQPWEELPGAVAGRARYRRRFNRPTGLDAWERVSLEIDRIPLAGDVTLNGQSLGRLKTGEFFSADITSQLQPTNELCVEVELECSRHTPCAVAGEQTVLGAASGGDVDKGTADGTRSVPATNTPSHSVYIVDADEPLGSPVGDVRLVIRAVHPSDD